MQDLTRKTAFISYASEDSRIAERLNDDLNKADVSTWLAKDAILPGERWKIAINKAIRNHRYFIPLFSSVSVRKSGQLQKEFKYAIDYADSFPESEIFIIPTRLDECEIPYEKLQALKYVDLFPNWEDGVSMILLAMGIQIVEKDNIPFRNEWRMGLPEEIWQKMLVSICNKRCIPFIGTDIYSIQSEDGKTLFHSSKNIIDHWKEDHRYPLEDLYQLANVYTLEDSYQLARIAQFLEIGKADEMYPKNLLSEMLKNINVSDLNSQFRNNSPYDTLGDLNLPLYMTTNYDRFLEVALLKYPNLEPQGEICKWNEDLVRYLRRVGIHSIFDNKRFKLSIQNPIVYHILGIIDTPQSMVLTEKDYFEYVVNLNRNPEKDIIPSPIRTELGLSNLLLFIGYNLDDVNFRVIFQGFLSFLLG